MKKKLKIIKSQKGLSKDLTKKAVPPAVVMGNPAATKTIKARDSRIPVVGTIITRKYKGEPVEVKVLEKGFEYKGQVFKSISALAVHIVGSPISGYVFFKL